MASGGEWWRVVACVSWVEHFGSVTIGRQIKFSKVPNDHHKLKKTKKREIDQGEKKEKTEIKDENEEKKEKEEEEEDEDEDKGWKMKKKKKRIKMIKKR